MSPESKARNSRVLSSGDSATTYSHSKEFGQRRTLWAVRGPVVHRDSRQTNQPHLHNGRRTPCRGVPRSSRELPGQPADGGDNLVPFMTDSVRSAGIRVRTDSAVVAPAPARMAPASRCNDRVAAVTIDAGHRDAQWISRIDSSGVSAEIKANRNPDGSLVPGYNSALI